MSKFSTMSPEEQKEICMKIAECLKDNNLSDINVSVYREDVCQMRGELVQERIMLKVEKQLSSEKQKDVDDFNRDIKTIVENIEGITINVNCVLGAGQNFMEISNVTTLDDDKTELIIKHTEGEVMMIDFWATWCPPCQKPMQHNEDMLTNNGERWGDKVKIIGLSIDKNAETVQNHINNKNWLRPIHYWIGKSQSQKTYAVKGVPHVMIIDTKGVIAFKGHPANRPDLVADFDNLLAGKTLEGEGCKPSPAKADDEVPEGFKETNDEELQAIHAQMSKFVETGKQMQEEMKEKTFTDANEKVTKVKDMARDFCVLTLEANMSPNTMKWLTQIQNHRVLVGTQQQVDVCKAFVAEKLKNEYDNFELKEQYHVI